MQHDPDRILARIDRSGGITVCHLLPPGSFHRGGYAAYVKDGHERRVTHLVLEADGRPLGPGQLALHHCDNPPCCNVKHLYRGTQADNIRDSVTRRRHATAKLSDDDIAEIRSMYRRGYLQREIGEKYGISQGNVSQIVNGRSRA